MKVSVLGIDLGKTVCSIVGFDASGAVVLRRRAKRETLIGLAAKLLPASSPWRPAVAAITLAGCSQPRTRSPADSPDYVRPYVKAQKKR